MSRIAPYLQFFTTNCLNNFWFIASWFLHVWFNLSSALLKFASKGLFFLLFFSFKHRGQPEEGPFRDICFFFLFVPFFHWLQITLVLLVIFWLCDFFFYFFFCQDVDVSLRSFRTFLGIIENRQIVLEFVCSSPPPKKDSFLLAYNTYGRKASTNNRIHPNFLLRKTDKKQSCLLILIDGAKQFIPLM